MLHRATINFEGGVEGEGGKREGAQTKGRDSREKAGATTEGADAAINIAIKRCGASLVGAKGGGHRCVGAGARK